jgi:hypothetical protein
MDKLRVSSGLNVSSPSVCQGLYPLASTVPLPVWLGGISGFEVRPTGKRILSINEGTLHAETADRRLTAQ